MEEDRVERKLAAILYADVAGFSRLTSEDAQGTHRTLIDYRNAFAAAIKTHGGEVVQYAGDAILANFPSLVDALACAMEIQRDLGSRNESLPEERQLRFRIGINVGEIIVDQKEIYGEGVNIAARLEALAEPGGVCISEAVRTAVGKQLPVVFHDMGEQAVKNIPEPVRAYHVQLEPGAELPLPARTRKSRRRTRWSVAAAVIAVLLVAGAGWLGHWMARQAPDFDEIAGLPLPDKPSIAVLPFDNFDEDPGLAYFADGITEDIITDLSKFSDLFVVARHSVFRYKELNYKGYKDKDKGKDFMRDMGRELGVRYGLEGSVQKEPQGGIIRITAQLLDTTTGNHVWADKYDLNWKSMAFTVRDRVVQRIIASLMGSDAGFVERAERQRALRKDEPNAYDYLMRGWEHWYRAARAANTDEENLKRKNSNLKARDLFQKALEPDRTYARAYSALAWTYAEEYDRGWTEGCDEEWTEECEKPLKLAFENAKKGYELDSSNYRTNWALGWAHLYQWEHDQAIKHYERALDLNPNDAELLAEMGNLLIYVGQPGKAIEQIKLAMRLNPLHEQWYTEYLGWAYEEAGQPEEAIKVLETLPEPDAEKEPEAAKEWEWVRRTLAASYAAVGEMGKAREQVQKILELNPEFSLAGHEEAVREEFPYKTDDRDRIKEWVARLRKAGVPE